MQFICVDTFSRWRSEARRLIAEDVSPCDVSWTSDPQQPSLFGGPNDSDPIAPAISADASKVTVPKSPVPKFTVPRFTVPKSFLELAKTVACHRSVNRWELLYRVLWRIVHGESALLQISSDDDVHALTQMRKAVTRDVHKMKAFVRFREVSSVSGEEAFVAWHRPDHRIVKLAAPFFARRFKGMIWTILTPDESASWDKTQLHFGEGVPVSEAPSSDDLEELWKTYYASIFNPARVKVKMMKQEMPVRHWATLPEAELIDDLLRQAPTRVAAMIEQNEGFADTASKRIPSNADLRSLSRAAASCTACDLHRSATQTVFGAGPTDAKIMLIGEQPGDREDLVGQPFQGPAGELLHQCISSAGLDPSEVYFTNTVKHFKFQPRGERRLHQKPNSREVYACRPWLEAEIAMLNPEVIVCLGATASQAILGRDFRLSKQRGQMVSSDWCDCTIATWHPAAILRMRNEDRRSEMRQQLTDDLRRAPFKIPH